ncbi:hypothetical protein D3C72_1243360 [compost metagenome]
MLIPPSVKEFEVELKPFNSAFAVPLMERFPLIVVAAENVLIPELLNTKLL